MGKTPSAIGSSVPAWPTRFWPARRRTLATTSCEVQPFGLLTLRMPTRPIAARSTRGLGAENSSCEAGGAICRGEEDPSEGEDLGLAMFALLFDGAHQA